MSQTYKPCPSCNGTILSQAYLDRYGNCKSCHLSLNQKLYRAL